jgi:hypothetical protein
MRRRGFRSDKERRTRSRIHYLIRDGGIMRASILTLETRCGKPGCRCARGQRHLSTVVEQSRRGRTRMRTVRVEDEGEVRQWVGNFREVQGLLEELSEVHWDKLALRKKG